MVIKKLLIPTVFLAALLSIALVWAGGFSASASPTQVESGATTQLLTFTIINPDPLGSNITRVNITLPSGFLFIGNSNQTSIAPNVNFTNTSSVLTWVNTTTSGLIAGQGGSATFTFNVSVPLGIAGIGHYNFTVGTVHNNTLMANVTNVSVQVIDNTPPTLTNFYPDTDSNVTTLKFNVSVNVNELNLDNVWYYLVDLTGGTPNSANVSITFNTTTKVVNATTRVVGTNFSQTITLNFTSGYTGPGRHQIVFCVNDTSGNTVYNQVPSYYAVKVANVTQIKDYIVNASGNTISWNLTFENGTRISDDRMAPLEANYTMHINATLTTFVEIVGFQINETLAQNIGTTNQSSTITNAVQSSMYSSGYNTTDFIWYNVDSFLPNASFYKYGRIQLPKYYDAVFYCSGTDASVTNCSKINACGGWINATNYTAIPANSGCYNTTESAGKTVLYVKHFSGGGGGNDTLAPAVTVIVPASNSAYRANFTVNITVTDGTGINISKGVYYRLENNTYNSTWFAMSNETTNTTANSFNATFDITSVLDNNYTFRFNATDLFDQVNATTIGGNVIIDDTPPTISSCSLSASSVTVNDALTATCVGPEDNSESFGGSQSCPATNPSTSATGTFTATCTVTDIAGNPSHATASYTVSLAPSGTTGGGGGGGVGGGGATSSVIVSVINPGKVEAVTGFSTAVDVTAVDLEVKNTVNGVSIAVQKLTEKPTTLSTAPSGAAVYTYLRITVPTLTADNIKTANIEFAVPKSWLTANDIDKNTVALNRYGVTWDKLTTSLTSEDASNVYYKAETPDFSIFAITGDKSTTPAEKTKTTGAKTTAEQTTTGIKSTAAAPKIPSGTAGILVLLVIICLCLYWYKHKSGGKKKLRKH